MDKVVPVEAGAEAFIELLNANGVEYIFLNPGTDTIPVQEAIAKFNAQGKRTPGVVLCLHESVAMSAAHGYFVVSGRPQVVLVHVDAGTQNVGGALHNAQRGRIGVVFCAGRAPIDLENDELGGRWFFMWIQDRRDQTSIVRDYVKWDYELRSTDTMHRVVQRAFQLAATEPCGPVYLTLPLELLIEKIDGVCIPDVARHAAVTSPQADPVLLDKAAEVLIDACGNHQVLAIRIGAIKTVAKIGTPEAAEALKTAKGDPIEAAAEIARVSSFERTLREWKVKYEALLVDTRKKWLEAHPQDEGKDIIKASFRIKPDVVQGAGQQIVELEYTQGNPELGVTINGDKCIATPDEPLDLAVRTPTEQIALLTSLPL